MSISLEIARIQNAKSALKTSINAKTDSQHQITNETIDDYADFVDSITSGGEHTGAYKVSSVQEMNAIDDMQNGDYCIINNATPDIPALPNTYKNVEYVQSNGSQYINTGIKFTSTTKIDLDIAFIGGDSSSWVPVFGSRSGSWNADFAMFINTSNYKISTNYANFDAGSSTTVYATQNVKFNLKNNAGQFYINDIYQSSISTTNTVSGTNNNNIYLFALNNAGSLMYRNSKAKIYRAKFYDGDTLIRDFAPCYRKSDNVIGLYDLVNDVFYTNSGSGSFSKGNDANSYKVYYYDNSEWVDVS